MRTTVRLDEALLRQAKRLAAETGRTLTSLIEDGLREILMRRDAGRSQRVAKLPTFRGDGLRKGVSLDHGTDLLDLMDEADASS